MLSGNTVDLKYSTTSKQTVSTRSFAVIQILKKMSVCENVFEKGC